MARVLITSGPTREPLDPVRFLSNASTGRMGAALARAAARSGHSVDVVSGPGEIDMPRGVHVTSVMTAREMLTACERLHGGCDLLIGAAAVSDYRPARTLTSKRVRDGSPWSLELIPNPDILEELGRRKQPGQKHVGFALETAALPEALGRARGKLVRKNLDWVVLNSARAIGSESEQFWLIPREGEPESLGHLTKDELASALFAVALPDRPF